MQNLLYFAYTKILTIGGIITLIGFTLSAEYAFTKAGFILVFILYLLACIPWGIFYYQHKYEASMTKREVDQHYLHHLFFFIFIHLFAYQGSKVIIMVFALWAPSTTVTTPVMIKETIRKSENRGTRYYLIHTIWISVPRERFMILEVSPSVYNSIKKGQRLQVSARQTPFADVYSGFHQAKITPLDE